MMLLTIDSSIYKGAARGMPPPPWELWLPEPPCILSSGIIGPWHRRGRPIGHAKLLQLETRLLSRPILYDCLNVMLYWKLRCIHLLICIPLCVLWRSLYLSFSVCLIFSVFCLDLHTMYSVLCVFQCVLLYVWCQQTLTSLLWVRPALMSPRRLSWQPFVRGTLLDWIVQCFTSPPTQYRLYGRRAWYITEIRLYF